MPISTETLRFPPRHRPIHTSIYAETVERCELRSDESQKSNFLSVTHGGRQACCELRRAGIPILNGNWNWKLSVAGADVGSKNQWTNICSEINEHAAYVELQLDLDHGFQIDRQVFLARQDGFAFLADVVTGPQAGVGEYRMRLPLAVAKCWEPATETQDGQILVGRRRVATVLPLCLPEWRSEPGGRLESTDGQLVLTMPLRGRRLQAALFIDLDSSRLRRPVTWRRLTVAESLTVVPRDVAVGYRVQVGKSQWLVYRSLAPRGNRTVLGQNVTAEFVVARFRPDGMVEKLLEIE